MHGAMPHLLKFLPLVFSGCRTAHAHSAEFFRLGAASVLMLLSLMSDARAQRAQGKDMELCNGVDRTSPDPQIIGCTAVIEAGGVSAQNLAIAYNNRGNALTRKGEYERAIEDFSHSIRSQSPICKGLQQPRSSLPEKGRVREGDTRL